MTKYVTYSFVLTCFKMLMKRKNIYFFPSPSQLFLKKDINYTGVQKGQRAKYNVVVVLLILVPSTAKKYVG